MPLRILRLLRLQIPMRITSGHASTQRSSYDLSVELLMPKGNIARFLKLRPQASPPYRVSACVPVCVRITKRPLRILRLLRLQIPMRITSGHASTQRSSYDLSVELLMPKGNIARFLKLRPQVSPSYRVSACVPVCVRITKRPLRILRLLRLQIPMRITSGHASTQRSSYDLSVELLMPKGNIARFLKLRPQVSPPYRVSACVPVCVRITKRPLRILRLLRLQIPMRITSGHASTRRWNYASLGRIADAEGLYRRILDAAPENVPAMTGLGLCARDQGKHETALTFFNLAASANMDRHNHSPTLEAATELRTLGRFADLEALCHNVLELDPDNVRALLGLGFAARASGRHAAALDWFCKADQASASGFPGFRTGLEVAAQLRLLGKPEKAEAICRRLLKAHGQTVPILLGLVKCLRQLGDRGSSLELLWIAAGLDKLDLTPRLEIAVEQRRQGDTDAAIATLEELRRLHPNEVRVYLELGRTFRQAGRLADALVQFTQAAELRPDRVEVQMELAGVTGALGRPKDSRRHVQQALEAQPHHTGALIAASRIAFTEYEYELAEHMLRHALAEAPEQLPLQLALADLLRQLGRTLEAAACINAAAAMHGELPEISARRAALALDTSEWQEALNAARTAFASAPWHPFLWEQWLRLEERGGDEAAITACLEAAPVGTVQQRAQHAFRCGTHAGSRWHLDEAIAFQTAALRLNPEHRGALQDLARLSLLSLDIDKMRDCLRDQRRLNDMTVRLQGRSSNISQTHLGQLADEFRIDRQALVTLQWLRKLPPLARAQELLHFQMKHPNSTAGAVLLIIALRQAGLFDHAKASGTVEIPRTIVQYWDTPELPEDLAPLCKSWQSLNPEYQYRRFNDRSAQMFLLTQCGINALAAYFTRARAGPKSRYI